MKSLLSRATRVFALTTFAVLIALPAAAQKKKPNDPSECPYCHNDPEVLKAAGLVSHGGFAFGKADNTAKVDTLLPECEIRWIETEHFKIGFGLGPWKVKIDEKKKTVAELMALRQFFPDVKPDTGILDPWLRTHMYARRAEQLYTRFLELMNAADATFPAKGGMWVAGDTYMGEGPYLGQALKYEFIVVPTINSSVTFLTEHCGVQSKKSQRWHYTDLGSIALICAAEDGSLRTDGALWGHLAFNLAHNLYDGFLHYNYDTPIWLHEGFAHFMEREVNPKYNSFDSDEGSIAQDTRKENWKPDVLALINSGKAPRMAELVGLKRFSEVLLPHHYTTWSMIDFLVATKPAEFAKFMWSLKRNFTEQGIPTGEKLNDLHRAKFKEYFGWTYPEFDEAWKAWCLTAYKATTPKGSDPNSIPSQPGGTRPPGG